MRRVDEAAIKRDGFLLETWPGAFVVATHDRRLRSGLRLDREISL